MGQVHTFPEGVKVSAGDTFRWRTAPMGKTKIRQGTVTRVMDDDFWDKLFYVTQDDGCEYYHGDRWQVRLAVPNARNTDKNISDDVGEYRINPEKSLEELPEGCL